GAPRASPCFFARTMSPVVASLSLHDALPICPAATPVLPGEQIEHHAVAAGLLDLPGMGTGQLPGRNGIVVGLGHEIAVGRQPGRYGIEQGALADLPHDVAIDQRTVTKAAAVGIGQIDLAAIMEAANDLLQIIAERLRDRKSVV